MIKTIIFDWGGVLTEGNHTSSLKRLWEKRYGIPYDNIRPFSSVQIHLLDEGKISTEEFAKRFNEHFYLNIDPDKLAETFGESIPPLIDDVIELIKELKEKYLLIMLSNNNPPGTARMRKDFPRIMKLFRRCYISFEERMAKPDKRFFELPLKDFNLKPEECVFIDDQKINTEAAKELGIKAIHFKNPEQLKEDLNHLLR